jgi:alpha-L-fucosidase 2
MPDRRFALALFAVAATLALVGAPAEAQFAAGPTASHDLVFMDLAATWDEGLPLGNGMLGALIWAKNGRVRLSLDRADLWDLRPMENLKGPEWTWRWVLDRWRANEYKLVQDRFDRPYDANPAPTKIPAGALEFDLAEFGHPESVRLSIRDGLAVVTWPGGRKLEAFVHASKPEGWFRITGGGTELAPLLVMPPYQVVKDTSEGNSLSGQDLGRLGYPQGAVRKDGRRIVYRQEGWGGFDYEIAVLWRPAGKNAIEGAWSISSKFSDGRGEPSAETTAAAAIARGYESGFAEHAAWWRDFWAKSAIEIPDKTLEKHWYLEQYKFGSAARRGAPPISLQAVWTADDGRIPPWKGDFHHDLNTQLSYWPCYSANHLEEGLGFLDWLWEKRPAFKAYTKAYFGTDGLNVPGVSTLAGEPMGGWIQYSFGPTVGAWLAQHFDLHWKYSRDRSFLEERAYPWVKDVAIYLERISERGSDGKRKLPASSSPEIFDNSARAWFARTGNFDLALIRWTFRTAAVMAEELGRGDESKRWRSLLAEWPDFAVDPQTGLLFAPGVPYRESHRHFSHLMAFHPLGLIDMSNGPKDRRIIQNTLATLDKVGPDWWCGYSYAWLGNLKARAFDGEGAAEALRTFATAFCLPNSFHVNGDQTKSGKSKFTYRPFTLEGNFAFAAGVQEMLLQSQTGTIHLFPAVPAGWKNASFDSLRAQGAFLISAQRINGQVLEVRVVSEKGGPLRMANPFEMVFTIDGKWDRASRETIELDTQPGQVIVMEAHDESSRIAQRSQEPLRRRQGPQA